MNMSLLTDRAPTVYMGIKVKLSLHAIISAYWPSQSLLTPRSLSNYICSIQSLSHDNGRQTPMGIFPCKKRRRKENVRYLENRIWICWEGIIYCNGESK